MFAVVAFFVKIKQTEKLIVIQINLALYSRKEFNIMGLKEMFSKRNEIIDAKEQSEPVKTKITIGGLYDDFQENLDSITVNQPVRLVKEVIDGSKKTMVQLGRIIPRSPEAVATLKNVLNTDDNISNYDLLIESGSTLEFSGNKLPLGLEISNNSTVILDKDVTILGMIVTGKSKLHFAANTKIIGSKFDEIKTCDLREIRHDDDVYESNEDGEYANLFTSQGISEIVADKDVIAIQANIEYGNLKQVALNDKVTIKNVLIDNVPTNNIQVETYSVPEITQSYLDTCQLEQTNIIQTYVANSEIKQSKLGKLRPADKPINIMVNSKVNDGIIVGEREFEIKHNCDLESVIVDKPFGTISFDKAKIGLSYFTNAKDDNKTDIGIKNSTVYNVITDRGMAVEEATLKGSLKQPLIFDMFLGRFQKDIDEPKGVIIVAGSYDLETGDEVEQTFHPGNNAKYNLLAHDNFQRASIVTNMRKVFRDNDDWSSFAPYAASENDTKGFSHARDNIIKLIAEAIKIEDDKENEKRAAENSAENEVEE